MELIQKTTKNLCQQSGCPDPPLPGRGYCEKHQCGEPNCPRVRYDDSDRCYFHLVLQARAKLVKK